MSNVQRAIIRNEILPQNSKLTVIYAHLNCHWL